MEPTLNFAGYSEEWKYSLARVIAQKVRACKATPEGAAMLARKGEEIKSRKEDNNND